MLHFSFWLSFVLSNVSVCVFYKTTYIGVVVRKNFDYFQILFFRFLANLFRNVFKYLLKYVCIFKDFITNLLQVTKKEKWLNVLEEKPIDCE